MVKKLFAVTIFAISMVNAAAIQPSVIVKAPGTGIALTQPPPPPPGGGN